MRATQQVDHACVQALAERQLSQGGWPFTADAKQMAVEPTALALLVLPSTLVRERHAAIRSLLQAQNTNGSWPAFLGDDQQGSGYTGLALYVLNYCTGECIAISRAVHWLLDSRGWEAHWLWKWKFRTTDRHVRFDPDKFGWPWTPETVSWVVPTSYSLLALKCLPAASRTDLIRFRIQRGVEMLFDRASPNGGWNAGNGVVYGESMAPHIDTTSLALLALQSEPANQLVAASLNWLQQRAQNCLAPWSLAWAILALDAYRLPTASLLARLGDISDPDQIQDCSTLAVVFLAFDCAVHRNVFRVTS